MLQWIRDKWHARQRALDLQILWPACVRQARDLDHAKAAFSVHAFNDSAWLSLGHDEIMRRIDALQFVAGKQV
jgi:hypothetical protein